MTIVTPVEFAAAKKMNQLELSKTMLSALDSLSCWSGPMPFFFEHKQIMAVFAPQDLLAFAINDFPMRHLHCRCTPDFLAQYAVHTANDSLPAPY